MSFTKDKAGLIKTVGGISLFDGIRSNATATPDMDGLMSAADKEKLDSLHNYVHPDSGVIPGKYLVVEVDERGHVIAGKSMKYSTLADFGIADAYIDLEDNSVVLGSHRVKVISPDDKVRWDQLVDVPNSRVNEWQTDITYHVNDLVIYDNMVYRCEVEHVSTTFDNDEANWVEVGAKPHILDWEANTQYKENEVVVHNGAIYRALNKHMSADTFDNDEANWAEVGVKSYIPDWQPDVQYKENEIVAYDSVVYRAVQKHTSAKTFVEDIAKWQRFIGGIDSWATGKYYPVGTVVVNGNKLYQCLTAHTSTVFADDTANWKLLGDDASTIVLPEWTAGESYKEGQLVKVQYLPYIALDTHVASGNFDNDKTAHWQAIGGSSSSGSGGSSTVVINKTAVNAWQANTAYTAGQLVTFNEALYRAKADHTSAVFLDERADKWDMLTNGIFEWEANKNYFKGMFAVADGFIYQCLVDIQSATSPADDSEHWQSVGSNKIAEYVRDVTKTNNTLTITKGDGSQTTIKLENGGVGGAGSAKVVVYVPVGAVVTCTDEATSTVVDTKTAENESKVVFDLGYGTYTFSTPTNEEGAVDTQTINVTELKIYYISLDNGEEPSPTAYILRVITEPNSVIKVTTGSVVQTKAMGATDSSVHFTIPDVTIDSTVAITKNGATRTETVTFEQGTHGKTVRYSYAKLNVTGRVGQTIVISKDSYSYTTVVKSATEEYTIYVPEFGTWSLIATGADGEITRKTCDVTEYKDFYASCSTKLFAFKIDGTVSDPAKMITYLEENKDFTPAKMNYNTNQFDWGSWDSKEFFIPRPCMLKYDGTVDYYLNENNYSLRADTGEDSDISNPNYEGNAMMEWGRYGKKIWYKIVPSGSDNSSATIYIADNQVDNDYHVWSFINAAGEMADHFYTPIYAGTVINGKMRSLSGFEITNNNDVEGEVAYAEANNPDDRKMWYTEVYADVTLINFLLMLIGKSTDTQKTFGYGNCKGSKSATGQLDNNGLFFGTKEADVRGVKIFGMENWWGNVRRRYAGHVTNTSGRQCIKFTYGKWDGSTAPAYNTNGSGYIETDFVLTSSGGSNSFSGYIEYERYGNKFGMIPNFLSVHGSATTKYCDKSDYYFHTSYPQRGGSYNEEANCGAFYVDLSDHASQRTGTCAAVSCKPVRKGK